MKHDEKRNIISFHVSFPTSFQKLFSNLKIPLQNHKSLLEFRNVQLIKVFTATKILFYSPLHTITIANGHQR